MRSQAVDELFLPGVTGTWSQANKAKPLDERAKRNSRRRTKTLDVSTDMVSPHVHRQKRYSTVVQVRSKSKKTFTYSDNGRIFFRTFGCTSSKASHGPKSARKSVILIKKASVLTTRSVGAASTASTSSTLGTRFERLASQVDRLPWMRQNKGETLEQLYNSHFFNTRIDPRHMKRRINRLPVLALSAPSDASIRPFSMLKTPTKFYDYENSKPGLQGLARPFSFAVRRQTSSLLPTLDEDSILESLAKHALPLIAEAPSSRKSRPLSTKSYNYPEKRATILRLSSGSMVTVVTPDIDAWKRSSYTHGPVRLHDVTYLAQRLSLVGLALWEADEKTTEDLNRFNDGVVDSITDFFIPMISEPVAHVSELELKGDDTYWDAPLLDCRLAEAIANMRIGSHIRKNASLV